MAVRYHGSDLESPTSNIQHRTFNIELWTSNVRLRKGRKTLEKGKRWLMLIQRAALLNQAEKVNDALLECEELIKIFVQSIRTAEGKRKK